MLGKNTVFSEKLKVDCRGKQLDLNEAQLMGILNLTSDSFYDGGSYVKDHLYLKRADEIVVQGAEILDIGAASTKPGSFLIQETDEWKILKPALKKLRNEHPQLIISVDTYHASTAEKAADLGVDMINDISGGTIDKRMFDVVAENNLAYVLMHIFGIPETMQQKTFEGDILEEVNSFFGEQLQRLREKKIKTIFLDPGFGFGKTIDQNYCLLKNLSEFSHFYLPLLVGVSRKSMIFRYLQTNPQQALNGTTVLNTFALQNGAKLLRVHDVAEAKGTIRLFLKYNQF